MDLTPRAVLEYVASRTVTIYPLYAAGLLATFLVEVLRNRVPPAGVLVAQTWLLQAWIPPFTEKALLVHCWFISCLVPYWAAFPFLVRALRRLRGRTVAVLMALLFLAPWLVVIVPYAMGEPWDWYRQAYLSDRPGD